MAVGLLFVFYPRFHRAAEPYMALLNAMPRLALAPLFLLWFGLGVASKIAVGSSLTFFIVLSATVAGVRGVSSDHLVLSKTLGATPSQLFFKVTLPSAVPVIFSGLRLGLIFALLGVLGAEIRIAAEHGSRPDTRLPTGHLQHGWSHGHPAVASHARALRDPSHEPRGARSTLLAVNAVAGRRPTPSTSSLKPERQTNGGWNDQASTSRPLTFGVATSP